MRQRKKKILIGINDLCVGGAQRQVIRQLSYFNKDLYDIHVVTLLPCGDRVDLKSLVPTSIPVETFTFSSFGDIRSWYRLLRFLRKERPDVVLSNLFFSNTVFRVLKMFGRYTVVTCEHNTYIDKPKTQLFVDWVLSFVTEKIIAVSDEVKEFLIQRAHISTKKISVVYNGIDLTEVHEKSKRFQKDIVRKELGWEDAAGIILHVGRLAAQKNQTLLVEGFAKFVEEHPDWKLLIVGGGEEYATLKQLVETLNISKNVQLTGEQEEVYPYYVASDCFLTTSIIEGMSITHLEALAHGLPIISTHTGGTSAILETGETGFFVETYTPESVVEALEAFIRADKETLRTATVKKSTLFDITRTVCMYEECIEHATQ